MIRCRLVPSLLLLSAILCGCSSSHHSGPFVASLSFNQLPTQAVAGSPFVPAIKVSGVMASSGATVTLEMVESNGASVSTQYSGNSVIAGTDGTATFSAFEFLTPVTPGSYRLRAKVTSSGILTQQGTSDPFQVVSTNDDLGVPDLSASPDLSAPNIDVLHEGFIACTLGSTPSLVAGVDTYTRNAASTETIVVEGGCTTRTLIGNPGTVAAGNIGTVSCAGPGSTISCTASGGICFGNGSTSPATANQAVTLSWSGGDVGSGSTMLTVGPSVTTTALPSTLSRSTALTVSVSGGSANTMLLFTMTQANGSTSVNTQCRSSAGATSVVVPASVLARFQPGDVSIELSNESFTSVTAGSYTIGVKLDGDTTGPLAAITTVTLQ